ncbi:MAG: rhomboid family intramembrane serine protease [Planctomycetota bacterium]|jgi:membrane associated rhomboid family serine protease
MFVPYFIETRRDWEYRQRVPWLVLTLLFSYLGVHIYLSNLDPEVRLNLFYQYGVVACHYEWHTFFTCTFLHGGWLHLIGNCYFLWLFGVALEKLLGTARFLLLYGAGAAISMLIHIETIQPFMFDVPTIGASGAISAVLGGFFVLMPGARLRCLIYVILRPIFFCLPAFLVLGLWFAWQIYSTLDPESAGYGIAFWAHVAGFAAGAPAGTLLYGLMQHRTRRQDQEITKRLDGAWDAFFAGRLDEAALALESYTTAMPDSYRANQPLISGLLRLHRDHDPESAATELTAAFHRALNRLDDAQAFTVYCQMRNHLPRELIPASIHRDAAAVAISCRQPHLGLWAAARALEAGLDRGIGRILERTEAVLRNTLHLEEPADRVRVLIEAKRKLPENR